MEVGFSNAGTVMMEDGRCPSLCVRENARAIFSLFFIVFFFVFCFFVFVFFVFGLKQMDNYLFTVLIFLDLPTLSCK
jgi:hypothetical protein